LEETTSARAARDVNFKKCCLTSKRYNGANRKYFSR
jgi:hypothetical protein